ncbi:peptidase [Nonomuraea sp. 3-1Str]|uniref:peptidase n=1 Tax=Nonomuraea sp. 3-1Str TaxID=2929801 RepID=UPI0028590DE8|nr:peptidase [Nonomuraea sp. 3-1Str]MDR8413297.1 peptidase [Nonomuraea sp. 3-1Str]
MRLHNLLAWLLVAGALTPATGMLHAPASAAADQRGNGIGIRLVDAPVQARADSRARRYIVDHLKPGSVIHRRVEIANTTHSPQRVAVYPAAGEIRDRTFQFAPGRTANELSTWTSMSRDEVTLAPQAHSMVTATIDVPKNAAPGERYAMIWAEVSGDPPPGGGLREVNRVGVRIYLSVGGDNAPAAGFTIDSLTAQRSADGRQSVLAQVHNTGGRALDLSGELRLTSGGLSAGPYNVETGTTLAPGDTGSVIALLTEQVPDGPWHARIHLVSGLTEGTAAADIRFPSAAGTAEAVAATMDGHLPVAAIGAGAGVSALAAVSFLIVRRRHRSRRERATG